MAEFDWSELVPAHHSESEEIAALFDIWQDYFEDDFKSQAQQLKELKNPDKFPFDFKNAFKDMLGVDVPFIRGQDEESVRRQLGNVVESIKIKGLEIAVKNFFASLGWTASTEVMQSYDYFRFTPDDELKNDFGIVPDQFFYTPHVEIRMVPTALIGGTFLTDEIFNIIKNRLETRILPATTVPNYRIRLRAEAEEDHNTLFQNFVSGTSLNRFQRKNSEKFSSCHKVQDTNPIQSLRTFQYMYTEYAKEVEFGTFASGTQIDSGTTNLDTTLFTTQDFDVVLDQPNDRSILDIEVDTNTTGNYNGILVKDDLDQPILAYHFPELSTFDFDSLTVNWELIVNKKTSNITKAEVTEFSDVFVNEVDDPTTYATDEYYFNWDNDTTLREPFLLDKGLKLDTEDTLLFLAVMSREGSSWTAGDLDGATGDPPHLKEENGQPKMHNPHLDECDEFDLFFEDGHNKIVFEADLVQSPLFDTTIEQIGLQDEEGHLIVVIELDEGIEMTDQFDREKVRLTINNQK